MLHCEEASAVYLFTQPCDMRCGFDRLAAKVKQDIDKSVLRGGLYVFVSRERSRVKILYWDRDGYALWYKRLEAGVFRVEKRDGVEELSGVDLRNLLDGVELSRIKMRRAAAKGVYG